MTADAIRVQGLTKRYGPVTALNGLTFRVPRGSICGFLGRNGAGKTTTIKLLLGMARADAGTGEVLGYRIDDPKESIAIRQRTGYVSDTKDLYPCMTVEQAVRYTRGFFPGWRSDLEERYGRMFELPMTRKLGKLSSGTRTRVMLLLALCHGAEVLMLDEPTEGLDPVAQEELLQILTGMTAEHGTTVFFSSHQLTEVEQIADRVCIVHEGRTVVEDSLDELRENYRRVQVVFEQDAPARLLQLPTVSQARQDGRVVSALVTRDVEDFVERARAMEARSVDVQRVTLKEIFMDAVRPRS